MKIGVRVFILTACFPIWGIGLQRWWLKGVCVLQTQAVSVGEPEICSQ